MNLSAEEATIFLVDQLGGPINGLDSLQGGHWSQAYGFKFGEEDFVVRFGQHRDDFEKDQAAFQFNSTNLPVPEVLGIGPAFEGHYCISRRVFGEMLDALDATRMEQMVPAIFRTLDALRDAPSESWISSVGAPAVGWTEQLLTVDDENDRVFGWHDKMFASSMGVDTFKKALSFLRTHVQSCPQEQHLLHNDLLHRNVLVSNGRITGVFDWGCAGLGDFLYELAMFAFYAPWFPSMNNIDWVAEAKRHYCEIGLIVEEFEPRLRCYEAHLGLSGMAYSSFMGDLSGVEANALRTIERLGF